MDTPKTLGTTADVARLLGVSSGTVRRWAYSGRLTPTHRTPGGQARYDLDEVRDTLATN